MQSPQYLALGRLQVKESVHTDDMYPDDVFNCLAPALHVWDCNYADVLSAVDIDPMPLESLFVIPHCRHTGGQLLTSHCDAVPWLRYVQLLPEKSEKEEPKGGESSSKKRKTETTAAAQKREAMIVAMPWLEHLDDLEGLAAAVPEKESAPEEEEPSREEWDVAMQEAYAKIVHDVWSRLSADDTNPMEDFKVRPLQGKWTMEHKGVPCDAIIGEARGAIAESFCRHRMTQLSMRFSVKEKDYGGVGPCGSMARAFCHRMQYYLDAELRQPDLAEKPFPEALHEAYEEPSEFVKFAAGNLKAATRKRVAGIRKLCTSMLC